MTSSPRLRNGPWRVAILGLGHWYSAFGLARALREYPKATLAGVAWHDRSQLDAFSDAFGVESTTSYDALLDRDDVDIVQIAAPVSEIAELTVRAARAGKHLIVGKPMAMSIDEADRMVEAVAAAGVACIPMQAMMRMRAGRLRARIERGEIGDLVLLHQTSRWSIAEDWHQSGRPGWFADPRFVPGGAFIDEGIYWIDFFRWLTGGEIVEVDARMANLVHRDIQVEDWGQAFFTFSNGVCATLEAAWTIAAPRKSGPSPKQNSVVRLEAIGTRGEIVDQWFRVPGLAVLAAGAEDWVFERQSEDAFSIQAPALLDHLIACLEGRATPIATLREARHSLAAAFDAYRSAREGRRITVKGREGL
jgi:predicted dehydrogenase